MPFLLILLLLFVHCSTVAMDHAPSDFLLLLLDPRQIPAPSSFEHLLRFKPSLCGSPVAVVLPAFGPPASKRADSTGADSTTGTRAGDSMWKREERGGKKKEGGDERGGTQGGRGEVRAANSEAEEAFPAVSVACYDTWHLAEEVEAGRMELLSDLRDTSRVPELADTSQGTLGGRETGTALSLSGPDGVRRDAAAVAAWLRQEIPLTRDVSGDALWGLAGGVALHRSVLTPRLDPLFGEGDLALGSFLAELQAFGFQPMLLAGEPRDSSPCCWRVSRALRMRTANNRSLRRDCEPKEETGICLCRILCVRGSRTGGGYGRCC